VSIPVFLALLVRHVQQRGGQAIQLPGRAAGAVWRRTPVCIVTLP
jgi:hypothetical protein